MAIDFAVAPMARFLLLAFVPVEAILLLLTALLEAFLLFHNSDLGFLQTWQLFLLVKGVYVTFVREISHLRQFETELFGSALPFPD
jgi:hypothetical protein